LIFFNLINLGQFFLFLSGDFSKSIFLSFFGKFFICFNIWFPLLQHLKVSNKLFDEGILVRHLKLIISTVVVFGGLCDLILIGWSKYSFFDFLTFPSNLKTWVLFFQPCHFKIFIENFFKFQAMGDLIFVFSCLSCLYYFAFFFIKEIEKRNQNTDESFITNYSHSSEKKNSSLPNPIFLKTNEESRDYIGNLIDREFDINNPGVNKKNNSWAIKKKGINIPFRRISWNNELPFSKQGLWYEIKKKNK